MGGVQRMGAFATAAVLGLALVACGGDDESGQENVVDEATTTTTTEAGGDTDTTDVDLGDFSGECAEFAEAFAGAGAAVGSAFTGAPGEDLEAAAAYFEEVADQLPDEISDDFEIFARAYSDFAQGLADADIDFSNPAAMDPEALSELEALSEAFSSAEVQQASDNIEAYMTANCGG